MARFWRDEQLASVKIREDTLRLLYDIFETRRNTVPEGHEAAGRPAELVFLHGIIRFDGKGIRFFSLDDLLTYFRQAHEVERIALIIECASAISSSRTTGTFMELKLDASEPTNNWLTVSSDDGNWTDASFAAVKEVLNRCRTRNHFARSAWANFASQLIGIIAVFLLSLIAAVRMAPLIQIEGAFFITFLFVLLVFSNLWGYINSLLIRAMNRTFPNVHFDRPQQDRWLWLRQGLVIGVVFAVSLFLLDKLLQYVATEVGIILGGGV
ncbi:MAG: hypothetical protein WD672_15415 [Woeseia sp.]